MRRRISKDAAAEQQKQRKTRTDQDVFLKAPEVTAAAAA